MPGSKLHLVCDGGRLPLTTAVTAANIPVGPAAHPAGGDPWDEGYDSAANRVWLRRRGIRPRIAPRGLESSARLGRQRWKVERALSWLSCFRGLQVRWDRDSGGGLPSCERMFLGRELSVIYDLGCRCRLGRGE
jgi:transposase